MLLFRFLGLFRSCTGMLNIKSGTQNVSDLEDLARAARDCQNPGPSPKLESDPEAKDQSAIVPPVTFTCPQCGASSEVQKLSKGALRYCPRCGAANINPAQKSAAALALAEASSPAEALSIYNEILGSEPHNYDAWLGRGRALGALASLENLTLEECLKAMDNVIRFAPHDQKLSLAPDVSRHLESIALRFQSIATAMLNEYTNGQHNPSTVSQAWHVHCAASFQAIRVLQAAVEHDPTNGSALRNLILICHCMSRGIQCAVRNDVRGPAFAAGPLWFVAAAMVLPEMLKNGRIALQVTPPERAQLLQFISHYDRSFGESGDRPVVSPPLPPPATPTKKRVSAYAMLARMPWWGWLTAFCIVAITAATMIILWATYDS